MLQRLHRNPSTGRLSRNPITGKLHKTLIPVTCAICNGQEPDYVDMVLDLYTKCAERTGSPGTYKRLVTSDPNKYFTRTLRLPRYYATCNYSTIIGTNNDLYVEGYGTDSTCSGSPIYQTPVKRISYSYRPFEADGTSNVTVALAFGPDEWGVDPFLVAQLWEKNTTNREKCLFDEFTMEESDTRYSCDSVTTYPGLICGSMELTRGE